MSRLPTCLLSMGMSKPSCFVPSFKTKSIIQSAKQYAFQNIQHNKDSLNKIDQITDFLLDNVDQTKISSRYSAIDLSQYSDLGDYWQQHNFSWNQDKFIKNQVSLCTETSVLDACKDIISNANGIGVDFEEVKSKITHVITHIDAPMTIPPLPNTIIHELNLSNTCRTISIANHGCGGGNVAIEMSKDICKSNADSVVLCLCYQTATTYLDWFNTIPQTSDIAELRAHYIGNILFGDAFVGFLMGEPQNSLVCEAKYPLFKVDHSTHHLLPRYTSYIANLGGLRAKKTENRIGGFYMDSSLPDAIYTSLLSSDFDFDKVLLPHLEGTDFKILNDLDFSFHAGGKSILEAIEMMMKLKQFDDTTSRMSHAYDVLDHYGNVGASTSLLVLDKTIRNTQKNKLCHIGIAPGLSIYTHGFTRFEY